MNKAHASHPYSFELCRYCIGGLYSRVYGSSGLVQRRKKMPTGARNDADPLACINSQLSSCALRGLAWQIEEVARLQVRRPESTRPQEHVTRAASCLGRYSSSRWQVHPTARVEVSRSQQWGRRLQILKQERIAARGQLCNLQLARDLSIRQLLVCSFSSGRP